jgi:hypothetical protein
LNRYHLFKFNILIFLFGLLLIEKPAHIDPLLTGSEKITHCDGSQLALGQGTGTGTARLNVTCIFKLKAATQAGCQWLTSLEPSPQWETRAREFKLLA